MNAIDIDHPTGTVLTAYSLGQLNEGELAAIDGHLAECAVCRQVVDGVPPDTLLSLLRSAATDTDKTEPHGPSSQPAPPALLEHPRYRVGELLGVGGMGAVYKAEHLLMERPVALKVLNRELIDKPATIERFRREVRAAARLTHPNIVAAFDAEQAGDVHFLVMEYVEGVSLARRCMDQGPLSMAEACDYIRQAALGLQQAHECGMVHRDIKPQNLMLTPSGQVKILDFGLARFVMESAPAGALLEAAFTPPTFHGDGDLPRPITHTGIVMGTPDYIAPEQARDSHLADIRADIYSLGCTLYDLLAGHAPFPDGNAGQKVKAHLNRTPQPLKTIRRDLPTGLIKIIERMMAKKPEDRFQSPADVAKALTPFAPASKKPTGRKKWLLAAALMGFAAALVAAVVIYVQTDKGRIIIETNDDKIAVMIEKAGGVKIVDQANKREYHLQPGERDLPSGEYRIEVTEALGGLDFQVKKFELKRGKEVRLTAKFVEEGDGTVTESNKGPDRKRLKERLSVLKEIARQKEVMYQNAMVTIDKVLEAKKEVAKAELELCESDKDRHKVRETLVALAQDIVKFREAQFKAGTLLHVDLWKAQADLLEAQTALDAAKAGVSTQETPGEAGPLYRGKPANYWMGQFKDTDPKFRAEAVGALGFFARKNKEAIPLLVAYLKDKDGTVSKQASKTLGSLGPEVLPQLMELLNDKRSLTTFIRAAEAVEVIGPNARVAVPLL